MSATQTSTSTRYRVGLFALLALLLIGALTVFVNDKPFWWRPCQLVHINIEDASGLKMKSPVRSLGLQIGYLKTVELSETHVRLGICITAPVEVLPSTRAYIRGEGFLGDKFVELRPVKYMGKSKEKSTSWLDWFIPSALAVEDPAAVQAPLQSPTPRRRTGREIPVGERSQDMEHLVDQVDDLVNEMTSLTNNLKEAIRPQELRQTMQQLNRTLENASRTLSPEGGLNTTAQRTLAKLEDAIEQLRDQMTRINRGEGSVGMVLNDPSYAEELREAIRSLNRLLGRVTGIRFVVDLGAISLPAYDGGRGWFRLGIWPNPSRYYLLGVSIGPRGTRNIIETTTESGGVTVTSKTTQVEESEVLLTAMLGKVFLRRIDLSAGVLHGFGTLSAALNLGPHDREEMIIFRNDLYSPGKGLPLDDRISLTLRPFINRSEILNSFYLTGGFESIRTVNGATAYFAGAGLTFDDEDIKLLFSFL